MIIKKIHFVKKEKEYFTKNLHCFGASSDIRGCNTRKKNSVDIPFRLQSVFDLKQLKLDAKL